MKNYTINISTGTIMKLLIFFLIISFLYLIKEVILLIFVALILASAFDPWVDWFQSKKIPRGLAILVIYIVLVSVVSLVFVLMVPPISKEISQLSENVPLYYEKVVNGFNAFQGKTEINAQSQLQQGLSNIGENLPSTISNVFSTIFDVFGGIFSVLLVLVLTFYFTVQEEAMKQSIRSLTPSRFQPYLLRLYGRIQLKMGQWLRGQLILSAVIFTLTFIGLTILGVNYALVLAFVAGLFEIIPFIGPWLAAVPAIFFGFLQSPIMGVSVIILYIIIQELENHLIVPKVMSKAVGLNPLIVIIVILIGARLSGITGALIAVPVATAISVFLKDFMERRIEDEIKLAE
ncbi:MAG TPA: AI-2E family transporter [Patescibacteria group bacterium]|nr:AI-2E family transporter [Patescibacteria group bacterium]